MKASLFVFIGTCMLWAASACTRGEPEPLPTVAAIATIPDPTSPPDPTTSAPSSEAAAPAELAPTVVATPVPLLAESPASPLPNIGNALFAFVRDSGEGLFLTAGPGNPPSRFYELQAIRSAPLPSPERRRLAIFSQGRLYVAQSDGSGIVEITPFVAADWLIWSPDGDKVATVLEGDIHVVNADGTGFMRITNGSGIANVPGSVAWSPDGSRLAFTCAADSSDICVVRSDGTEAAVNLTNSAGSGRYREPAWSPDGTRISFVSSLDDSLQINLMNDDGSDQRQLTSVPGQHVNHMWSPDGAWIAFARFVDGDWTAFVVNADGSSETSLSGGLPVTNSLVPYWSPDGNRIGMLFTARAAPTQMGVATVNVDGSGYVQLADDALWASWSPGGTLMALLTPAATIQIVDAQEGSVVGEIDCQGSCEYLAWLQ